MQEFITHFGIDWKLFLAQIVNFSVILFLLRKFAYQPILKMLRDRKQGIERGVEMQSLAEKNLKESDEAKNRILQRANVEALAVVNRSEDIAKGRQEEIIKETDKKVEGIIGDARRIIDQEKMKMNDDVMAEAQDLVRSAMAKVLGKMPASERDTKLISEALSELKSI
jgi:F-type H+-transporting ATPase subunit b